MDTKALFARLDQQVVETPSWGYADCGTRFGSFPEPSAARTITEKLEDAQEVQRLTGICPAVAFHIPWDKASDWSKVKIDARDRGLRIGSINPNLFQDERYRLGSVCSEDAGVRKAALDHLLECAGICAASGSNALSLWYADGTNYPGQGDFRRRKRYLEEVHQALYKALPEGVRLLIEYKFFEPAFYHTDLADWGATVLLCQKLGPRAQVLVDTGHHAPGTNIEHIVAQLLDEGRLGGFHFNGRKYADDDLTVGAINPYELFLVYDQLVAAEEDGDARVAACARNVAYAFDQAPSLKNRVEATIQSAITVQEAYCKALLVDRAALRAAQIAGDVTGAEEVLRDAFAKDVRPLLAQWRQAKGLDPAPLAALRRSGYTAKRAAERLARHGKAKAGGGYQS